MAALVDTPAVFIQGARQSGKSTLARALATGAHPARYLSLDDASALSAAQDDPERFIDEQRDALVIDEVQRVPALFSAIKVAIDRRREPGRFLLTGSAAVDVVPQLSRALVGRIEIHTLWPFSQGEIEGRSESFVDAAFAATLPRGRLPATSRTEVLQRVVRGGYPEPVARRSADRREAWFESYLTTILQREVRDLANIEALAQLPRLLALAASRSAQLLNYSELARTVGLPTTTVKRYLALLDATFLIQTLPAWFRNVGKRLAKAPKLVLGDSGLAAHLLGVDSQRLQSDNTTSGHLLESFAIMELRKQAGWSRRKPRLFHYRTHAQREVDVVLELATGALVGVEIKASRMVTANAFAGLRDLQEVAKDDFVRGVVLYLGDEVLPFGRQMYAIPFSALWQW